MCIARVSVLIVFLFGVQWSPEAQADSYRCGRKLVKTGDSVGELVTKCGEPLSKDRGNESIKIDGVTRKQRVERWYYRHSKRRLERVVLIHDGKIRAIRMGER